MPEVSARAKQAIDQMSLEELIEEVNKGNGSRFTGANNAYLKASLEIAKSQQEDSHKEKLLSLAQEANNISKSANTISKIALFVAIGALLVAILTYCFK